MTGYGGPYGGSGGGAHGARGPYGGGPYGVRKTEDHSRANMAAIRCLIHNRKPAKSQPDGSSLEEDTTHPTTINTLNPAPHYASGSGFAPLDDGLQEGLERYDRRNCNNQYLSGNGQGTSIAGEGQYPNIGTHQNGPFSPPAGWAAGLHRQDFGGNSLPTVGPPWIVGGGRGQHPDQGS